MRYNLYTFEISGGSPGGGFVKIVAGRQSSALKQAREAVERLNKEAGEARGPYNLVDKEPIFTEPFDPPCAVHLDSGER